MKMNVYSVYDKAVNAFLQPFYARSAGEAIRSFTELANDSNTNVGRHPTDFLLMFLGEYDDNSGLFNCQEPMRLLGATEVLKVDPFVQPTDGSNRMGLNGQNGVRE